MIFQNVHSQLEAQSQNYRISTAGSPLVPQDNSVTPKRLEPISSPQQITSETGKEINVHMQLIIPLTGDEEADCMFSTSQVFPVQTILANMKT